MPLTIHLGELKQTWAARCYACKRLGVAENAVTRHGARMTFQNLGWGEDHQGWQCPECRTIDTRRTK